MTIIAGIEFHFDFDYHEINTNEAENYLKEVTYKYSSLLFNQNNKIEVILREGSIKATILVLGTLYIAIGQYGSFRSGIEYIIKDSRLLLDSVASEFIKNGINEKDIIKSKKLYCIPNRIHRILLAIENLEKKNSYETLTKEIAKIKKSIQNTCYFMDDQDAGSFILSLNKNYWPDDRRIPFYIEQYKLAAREEDVKSNPISNKSEMALNALLSNNSYQNGNPLEK